MNNFITYAAYITKKARKTELFVIAINQFLHEYVEEYW